MSYNVRGRNRKSAVVGEIRKGLSDEDLLRTWEAGGKKKGKSMVYYEICCRGLNKP